MLGSTTCTAPPRRPPPLICVGAASPSLYSDHQSRHALLSFPSRPHLAARGDSSLLGDSAIGSGFRGGDLCDGKRLVIALRWFSSDMAWDRGAFNWSWIDWFLLWISLVEIAFYLVSLRSGEGRRNDSGSWVAAEVSGFDIRNYCMWLLF